MIRTMYKLKALVLGVVVGWTLWGCSGAGAGADVAPYAADDSCFACGDGRNNLGDLGVMQDAASSDASQQDAIDAAMAAEAGDASSPGIECARRGGICVSTMRSNGGFVAMCPEQRLLSDGRPSYFGPGSELIMDRYRLGCRVQNNPEVSFEVCCLPGM
jgi:hypothetical protein